MSDQVVIIERHDGVALLTPSWPAARNPLNATFTQGLCDAIAARRVPARQARQDGCGGNSGAELAERALARSSDQRSR
jgi:hypothetical protein